MNLTGHEKHFFENIRKQAFFFFFIRIHKLSVAAERFETWGRGGGGLILHSAILIPLIKFFKIPFALFVSTSNLPSV